MITFTLRLTIKIKGVSAAIDFITGGIYRYTQNGLLHMLDRNRRIKAKPQKFQTNTVKFEVIITCEERVYDQTVDCK